MISWEKSVIEKIIQPKSKTLAVVQRQFFFLCGKYMSTILIDNRDDCRTICSAAIPFPAWKNPAKIHNKDDFCKPVNCRIGNRPNQTKPTPFFLCSSAGIALSYATCQIDSKVICISFHHIIK